MMIKELNLYTRVLVISFPILFMAGNASSAILDEVQEIGEKKCGELRLTFENQPGYQGQKTLQALLSEVAPCHEVCLQLDFQLLHVRRRCIVPGGFGLGIDHVQAFVVEVVEQHRQPVDVALFH